MRGVGGVVRDGIYKGEVDGRREGEAGEMQYGADEGMTLQA